jgi:hypothetical protein
MCRTNSQIRIRCNSNSNSNSNSRSTDENETDRSKNNDNDTINDSINDTINDTDNERPIYKSKLQRLNQAKSQKSSRRMNMKTTSKRSNKKSTTFQNNDYNNRYDNNNQKPTQSSSLPSSLPSSSSSSSSLSFMEGFQPNTQFSKLLNDNDKNPTKTQNDTTNNDDNDIIDEEYEYGIDSFLRGEYDRPFADDAAAPLPNHTPSEIVTIACKALRDLDIPTTDHGAAVFMRFCAPLSRGDRWGGNISGLSVGTNVGTSVNGGSSISSNSWKGIMRGSLTPTMFARRIRASEEFAVLLDWEMLDVTQGTKAVPNEMLGYESTVAFVNAALFFGDGTTPSMCQFTLKMFSGVWLIDSAVMNKNELFMEN